MGKSCTMAREGQWEALGLTTTPEIPDSSGHENPAGQAATLTRFSFSNFFPQIVQATFPSRTRTTILLLTAPPYVCAALGSLVNAWHSDKTTERGFHFSGPIAFGCIGYIICLATTNSDARYGASFIYVTGMYFANPLISTWTSNTMGRTPEKRAISVAAVNVLGQVGNIIGACSRV